MKTINFKFQQVVVTEVKTQYDYKIKAKSFEEAEKKFKKLFTTKIENGEEHLALKKLKPKKEVIEVSPISPETAGYSTITINYIEKKKKNTIKQELYNNTSKVWVQAVTETNKEMQDKTENLNDNQVEK